MGKIRYIISGAFFLLLLVLFSGYFYISYQVEGEVFSSHGTRIHYTVEGKGVPVVLVHGFAVNGDMNWRKPGVIDKLSEEFQVITIDLRGHGMSGKPHDADEYGSLMVDDVINLMDHLNIDKAHLVGYSLGGFIALKCVTTYPDRFITLVSMASGWEDPIDSKGFQALDKIASDLQAGKSLGPIINYFDEDRQLTPMHNLWVKFITYYLNDVEALTGVVMKAKEFGVNEEDLSSIGIPVCSIIGEEDPFLSSARTLDEKIRQVDLVVLPGADHINMPQRTDAKDTLLKFLKDHTGNV